MWRHVLVFGLLIGLPATDWSDTVKFTVNPANTGTVYQGGDFDLTSSRLDGTILAGQTLSLDLVLSDGVLARLFLSDPTAFSLELTVDTNAGTDPGFAGATTGYLLSPNGTQLGDPQVAGRADASDGSFSAGLVSFTTGDLWGADTVDISGAHFDMTLPGTGYTVNGARLRFSLNSESNDIEFGTPQELTEQSSTLVLTLVDLLALAVPVGWRLSRRTSL